MCHAVDSNPLLSLSPAHQDVEETVLERLIGLTEMFPDSVRNVSHSIVTGTIPLVKRTYSLTRTVGWIFFSSFALLVVPVSLEKERCQAQRELGRQVSERLPIDWRSFKV